MIYEHETSRSTGVAYLSRRTLVRVDGVVATAGEHMRRRGIAPATVRQRWETGWEAWECVSRKALKAGQHRPGIVPAKPQRPVVDHREDMHIHRVDFFGLPRTKTPHLAAWNGESWDVVDLPDGDCGIHIGNGRHCLRCAESVLWARQIPLAREQARYDRANKAHPWRKWSQAEERVESFRKAGAR